MIIIDAREPDPLKEALRDIAQEVQLPTGDYMMFAPHFGGQTCKVLVERKTPTEMLTSMGTGRFQEQIKRLVTEADIPLLLIEGHAFCTQDGFVKAGQQVVHWRYDAYQNLLLTVQLSGVALVQTDSLESTTRMLRALHDYFQKESHDAILKARMLSVFPNDLRTIREGVVAAIPGFGPEISRALIEHFVQPINVFLADEEEFTQVKGCGAARFRKMQEVIYPQEGEGDPLAERRQAEREARWAQDTLCQEAEDVPTEGPPWEE